MSQSSQFEPLVILRPLVKRFKDCCNAIDKDLLECKLNVYERQRLYDDRYKAECDLLEKVQELVGAV